MDMLTFISEVVKALAWPGAAVLIALMVKKPVVELIPFLRRLKYKELEMEFSKGIAELKAESQAIEPRNQQEAITKSNTSSRLTQLLQFSTRAAIMEAWLEVESAAVAVASSFWSESPSDTFKNYPKLGEYLLQCKVIDGEQLELFNRLRQLRNKAAHAEELGLSMSDAKSYIEMSSALAAHIRSK